MSSININKRLLNKFKSLLVAHAGLEPTECLLQRQVPYHLANGQYSYVNVLTLVKSTIMIISEFIYKSIAEQKYHFKFLISLLSIKRIITVKK